MIPNSDLLAQSAADKNFGSYAWLGLRRTVHGYNDLWTKRMPFIGSWADGTKVDLTVDDKTLKIGNTGQTSNYTTLFDRYDPNDLWGLDDCVYLMGNKASGNDGKWWDAKCDEGGIVNWVCESDATKEANLDHDEL